MTPSTFDRTLTELDHVRISSLLQRERAGLPDATAEPLEDLLDAAEVVPSREVASDVVTMNTQVLVRDLADGQQRQLTVCYPADAQPANGFVSVLSPVGFGLLGLQVGGVARWVTPDGVEHAAEVVEIVFQPEASGDYTA